MQTYLITNESLFQEDSNFIDSIKSFEKWARPMKNIWLIRTYMDRQSVYNKLKSSSNFTSKLLVIRVTDDWIAYNLPQEVVQWMQEGL